MEIEKVIKVYTDCVHEVLDYTRIRYVKEIMCATTGDRPYDETISEGAYEVLVAKKNFSMISDEEFRQADDVLADMDEEYHDWLMYLHLYNKGFIKEKIDAPEY